MSHIALFTSFHPDHGGGSVNLRSAIRHFRKAQVRWYYLGAPGAQFPNTQCLGPSLLAGNALVTLAHAARIWGGLPVEPVQGMVNAILRDTPERLWVVAMNEGLEVGRRLATSTTAPLHVSVQDDQPAASCRRSRRFRVLEPLALRSWKRLLRLAASVDVTSEGMRDYYREQRQLSSFVFHPFVPSLPEVTAPPPPTQELHIGHIGSVYGEEEPLAFLRAAASFAHDRGRRLKLTFIGDSQLAPRLPSLLPMKHLTFQIIEGMEEPAAVAVLNQCHLLYAMQPFDARSRVFSATSFPTKLTTYLQAQRPVFAHTPPHGSLNAFAAQCPHMTPCQDSDPRQIILALESLLAHDPPADAYETVRASFFGRDNVGRLENALGGFPWEGLQNVPH